MGKKKNSDDDFGFKNLDKFKFRNPASQRNKLIPEPPAPLPNIEPPNIDPPSIDP